MNSIRRLFATETRFLLPGVTVHRAVCEHEQCKEIQKSLSTANPEGI